MKHDDLGARLKVYERALERTLVPDAYVVARIDGRGLSRLTKDDLPGLERPFDPGFRDGMIATARHLAEGAGFPVAYAYVDPRTGDAREAQRQLWRVELELPDRDGYADLVRSRIVAAG